MAELENVKTKDIVRMALQHLNDLLVVITF